jgi:large-conductance mechanosensitive channel
MAVADMPMPPAPVAPAQPEKLNLAYHVIIGVASGIVAPFTLWAWIPALLTGMVIGGADVDRINGRPQRGGAFRVLAVTGGVLAMLFLGAIVLGFVAFVIVALAAFNDRVAARTTPTDQGIARILLFILTVVIWFLVFVVLKLDVNINIG